MNRVVISLCAPTIHTHTGSSLRTSNFALIVLRQKHIQKPSHWRTTTTQQLHIYDAIENIDRFKFISRIHMQDNNINFHPFIMLHALTYQPVRYPIRLSPRLIRRILIRSKNSTFFSLISKRNRLAIKATTQIKYFLIIFWSPKTRIQINWMTFWNAAKYSARRIYTVHTENSSHT